MARVMKFRSLSLLMANVLLKSPRGRGFELTLPDGEVIICVRANLIKQVEAEVFFDPGILDLEFDSEIESASN